MTVAARAISEKNVYGIREIHRRELFEGSVKVKVAFEDRQLPAPSGYHEILTRIYGTI